MSLVKHVQVITNSGPWEVSWAVWLDWANEMQKEVTKRRNSTVSRILGVTDWLLSTFLPLCYDAQKDQAWPPTLERRYVRVTYSSGFSYKTKM